jgi:hypothetical protein
MPDLARERLGTGAFMSTVCTARALPWRETAQVARRLDGLALMQVQGMAHAHARRARHRLSNGRPLSGLASLSRCVVRHTLTRCPKNERYAIGIFSFPIRAYCESVQQPAPPKSSALSPKSARRLDGKLENALTGAGIRGVDAGASTERKLVHYSSARGRLEYRQSWAARREIDRPARDLVAGGFELQDLPPGFDGLSIVSYCSDIGNAAVPEDRGVLAALSRLHAEGNKGAGAALVVVLEDGLDPWMPVDLSRIKRIVSLELLERDEITPWRGSDGNGPVEYYIIGTSRTRLTASSIVHSSRVILNKGARLSPSEEWANQGWGASTLELLHTERTSMHMAHQEMGTLILRANIDVAYFAELSEMICEEESEGRTTGDIDARLALMSRSRGQHRLIPLDAGRAEHRADAVDRLGPQRGRAEHGRERGGLAELVERHRRRARRLAVPAARLLDRARVREQGRAHGWPDPRDVVREDAPAVGAARERGGRDPQAPGRGGSDLREDRSPARRGHLPAALGRWRDGGVATRTPRAPAQASRGADARARCCHRGRTGRGRRCSPPVVAVVAQGLAR